MAPLAILNRLLHWYSGSPEPTPPAITTSVAVALSIIYVFIYVIPFYLSAKTRPSPSLSRDAPTVIRARIRAVTFSCILTCAATTYVARNNAHLSARGILHIYGWWPLIPSDLLKTFLLTAILFAGPLFESAIINGQWRSWIRGRSTIKTLSSSIGWRNYVAGPVTEEFVFRSMVIPLHILAQDSRSKLVFVTPLYFGIAHIHHCYEFKLTHPEVPLLPTLLRTLFQFGYTSVFGFYAAFVFLRTGNLPAVILAHSFCNWMGLPRFWGRVEVSTAIGPEAITSKGGAATPNLGVHCSDGRLHVAWTLVYYILLVAGAFAFYTNIWTLTASSNALIQTWSSPNGAH